MGRNRVCGVGVNDAEYTITSSVHGKQVMCPYYRRWKNLIHRCYNPYELHKHQTYIDAYVCEEWLFFSAFKSWMEVQDWEGKQLDKDLVGRSKTYSPDTCIFVSQRMNKLLTGSDATRGDNPKGVSFCNTTGKFIAACHTGGKQERLGYFTCKLDAEEAYLNKKIEVVGKLTLEHEATANSLLHQALHRVIRRLEEEKSQLRLKGGDAYL